MSAEDNTEDDKPKVEEEKDDQNGTAEQENDKGSPAKATSPKKETKSPAKSPVKKPVKKEVEKKEEKKEEEDEEDDEDDEDDDEEEDEKDKKVGLLDLPLEVSGARERKKVERLSITYATPTIKKTDIPEGSGDRLGDSPRIEYNLSRVKADDLKVVHRFLFNRTGSATIIKRNIRKFNGFPFKAETPEYEKKRANLDKLKMADLKSMCQIFELERSGTKEDLVVRLINFVLCPKVSQKPAPKSKRSKKSSSKKSSGKRKGKSKVTSDDSMGSDEKSDSGDDSNAEENDEKTKDNTDEDGAADDNTDDEDEEEKPVNKSKKTPKAKPAPKKKKETKKVTKKETKKPAAKKAPASKKRNRSSDDDDDDDSDNSDDEPLSKKSKQPPTDDELKALVKSILDGANLEEITMKTVCKQVYAKYPDFDLSDRKEFIKSTVRSNI